jgi:hypothetical protein
MNKNRFEIKSLLLGFILKSYDINVYLYTFYLKIYINEKERK